MLPHILICVADAARRTSLARALEALGRVSCAADDGELDRRLRSEALDLALIEPARLGAQPRSLIRALRALPGGPEVVLLGAPRDLENSAVWLAAGCLAVLDPRQPVGPLVAALEGLLARVMSERQNRVVSHARFERHFDALGSRSPVMQRFQAAAREVAAGDSPTLVRGEPGSGKAWIGPVLHLESPRAQGPFHSLRCSGVSEQRLERALFGRAAGARADAPRARRGLLERAHNGTLFLERTEALPRALQERLLQYLEDHRVRAPGAQESVEVDTRIVASANLSPGAQRIGGALIPDLRRRLGMASLTLPPLRSRPEDVPELATQVQQECSARYGLAAEGFSDPAMDVLVHHSWPGNVTELWSVVERSTLLADGDRIGVEDLPGDLLPNAPRDALLLLDAPWLTDPAQLPSLRALRERTLEVVERAYVAELLRATQGRVAEAARRAEVDPRSLFGRMRRYGLRKEDFKPAGRRRPRTSDS